MLNSSRSFAFTRSTVSRGIFRPAEIRFELRQPDGGTLAGTFVIKGRNAEWITADGRNSFRIRRVFWGQRWNYAGESEGRQYAKLSSGFFRIRIAFAEGGIYSMKAKRGGIFFPKRDYGMQVQFLHEEEVRMTLTTEKRRKLFQNEVTMPMEGRIESSLPGMAELWGMLLLFQTHLQMQQVAAAAG
jgi:hypothetical protein